jgi:hypothetical protein
MYFIPYLSNSFYNRIFGGVAERLSRFAGNRERDFATATGVIVAQNAAVLRSERSERSPANEMKREKLLV